MGLTKLPVSFNKATSTEETENSFYEKNLCSISIKFARLHDIKDIISNAIQGQEYKETVSILFKTDGGNEILEKLVELCSEKLSIVTNICALSVRKSL